MSNYSGPGHEAIEVCHFACAVRATMHLTVRAVRTRAYCIRPMQGLWIRHLPRPGERSRCPGGARARTTHVGPQKGGLIV